MPFRSNRPARLGKPRNDDSSDSPTSPPKLFDEHDGLNPRSPLHDSVQALTHKQTVSRRLLQREDSYDSAETGDMRNRLSRSRSSPSIEHHAEPKSKSSPSNVGKIVNNIESRIDIEQAINLLQELKKSASPEELVALHRALLPTKETSPTPSPTLPSLEKHAYTSVPPARKRSVMPPGLASRSGISEDVLRRQHEPPVLNRKSVSKSRKSQTIDATKPRSIEASPSRPLTPSGQHIHAGAFQHGSLRITNGAASPEPSIISRLVTRADDAQTRSIFALDLNDSNSSLELTGPPPSQHRQDSEIRPQSAHARCMSKAKDDLEMDLPLQRHDVRLPKSQYSTSDEQPRSQQREENRATHLSEQYLSDCNITASPYEQEHGLLLFGDRLGSCVEDEDRNADSAGSNESESRSDALSRLTGEYERDPPRNAIPSPAEEVVESIESPDDHIVRKKDSGYCSDVSASPLQRKTSGRPAEVNELPYPLRLADSEADAQNREPNSDTGSLYTFQEFVGCSPRSEVLPELNATLPPNTMPKKSPLSLFKSKSKKSGSPKVPAIEVEDRSSEARPRQLSSQTAGDGEKQSRKLQKTMPESVRRQRKKTLENLKAAQEQITTTSDGVAHVEIGDTDPRPSTSPGAARTEFRMVPQNNLLPLERPQSLSKTKYRLVPKTAEQLREEQRSRGREDSTEKPQERSSRKRGKSFSRLRGKSIAEPKPESLPPTSGLTIARKRSKSVADALIPVYGGIDISSTTRPPARHTRSESRQVSTASVHGDFNSVARALSSHFSTGEDGVSRMNSLLQANQKSYHSKEIDQCASTVKMPGSENKENDAPSHDCEMTSQTSRVEFSASAIAPALEGSAPTTPVAVGSSLTVEDRFPGWQGKPAVAVASNTLSWGPPSSLQIRPSKSRTNLRDAIPPLPELPADIVAKLTKADQMVAKKLKISPISSPNGSARNSIDATERKQIAAWKDRNSKGAAEARQAALDQLSTPSEEPESKIESDRGAEQRWSKDGSIRLPRPEDKAQSTSPTHDSQHPGWPSWEQQSTLWRQRRQALALTFGQDQDEPATVGALESAPAPEIKFSRYITPLGAHNIRTAAKPEHIDDAERFAQSYSDLIISDNAVRMHTPDIRRADSVVSTATFVTMSSETRPAKIDVSRTGSAFSSYSSVTTTTATSWSERSVAPGPVSRQHCRAKSSHVRPYRPTDATQAEYSRAWNLAKRCSGEASQDSLAAPPRPEHTRNRSSDSMFDRYSGGLNYGWHKEGGGFGGSAGTVVEQARRKGGQMREDLGLDLSDIPVFLQRNSFMRA